MESKKWLAMSQARTQRARKIVHSTWEEIAAILNKETGGGSCIRTAKGWSKYWKDKKGMVKRKITIFNSAHRNPSLADYMSFLDKYEQRVLLLINEGNEARELERRIKKEDSSEVESSSERESMSFAPDKSYQSNEDPMSCASDQQTISKPPSTLGANNLIDKHNGFLSLNGTTRRQRRKRMQSRRQMTNIMEKFLNMMERRADKELELAKTQKSLADSVAQLAESCSLMTQALVPMANAITQWANNNGTVVVLSQEP